MEDLMDRRTLTAPCGIDCFNCQVFQANLTERTRDAIATALGRDPASIACSGCRAGGCTLFPGACATRSCTQERHVEFCSDCSEFPCARLMPVADGATRYPHNLKLYNLCRIRAVGLDRWAEESKEIRRLYFEGKLVPGEGPVEKKA
jgi:hypothetical protein